MKKKLCIVVPVHWSALMGGSQYQARLLIERLLEAYDVEIFYLTVRADDAFVPAGYEIVRVGKSGFVRRYGHFFDAAALYRALALIDPDAIYQMIGCAHTGIAAFYARRNRARMIWRVTSDRSVQPADRSWLRPHRKIEKSCLEYGIRNADLIVAQSEYQKEQLRHHYGRDDAVVVRNFHPAAADSGPKDGRKLVVWIANLKPLKNPHAFVRLAESFRGRKDVAFLMTGDLNERSTWGRKLVEAMTAVPNLRCAGVLRQDDVNEILERAHVLVNTSDYEGFSNAFIQAWLRRVPVVSLKVDPDGLLSSGRLGSLSSSEDQLRRDVERLLDEPGLLARMGADCRRYALEHHSLANIDELARLLELSPRTRGPRERLQRLAMDTAASEG